MIQHENHLLRAQHRRQTAQKSGHADGGQRLARGLTRIAEPMGGDLGAGAATVGCRDRHMERPARGVPGVIRKGQVAQFSCSGVAEESPGQPGPHEHICDVEQRGGITRWRDVPAEHVGELR
ncbi:hypothetical protein IOE58_13635 [Brachybacterium sp. Marseille-Q2903]|uniref:Uncharacterized protein n=1 Tax=Brachybacterium epidermidis TaxID=2781983 RepID=A0ABR9W4V8_9MICO|nr:hypothetical protein [Brachybacterium epidermidis]MBE9405168.1 hypothetical protein [Brachybacterium epidermidis]